ncbi:MAG TPA: hypothetical protein V6C81_07905 [Planktothrix sp.]|jgi:hypothetical protein
MDRKDLITKKALLAIAFTGGLLIPQLPALSDPSNEAPDALISRVANTADIKPEMRACSLLQMAWNYSDGYGQEAAKTAASPVINGWAKHPLATAHWESGLSSFAEEFCDDERSEKRKIAKGKASRENTALASMAIHKALTDLDQSSSAFSKIVLYFIASRLCQKIGDTEGLNKCFRVLEPVERSCKQDPAADEETAKALSVILNAQAYGVIPLHIPARPLSAPNAEKLESPATEVTEQTFKECEKLRLRAAAITDRLPATNDLRRRAHRDLVIWYMQMGKPELAERQKQVLFELVGVNDDSILYPQSIMCGQVAWWHPEKVEVGGACGMG